MRELLADFGGHIGQARACITDPARIAYRPVASLLLPPPWFKGRVLVIGDAAHTCAPQLASGATIAIEDSVVLADLIQSGQPLEQVLDKFMARRYERCRMVVHNPWQLGESGENSRHATSRSDRTDHRLDDGTRRADLSHQQGCSATGVPLARVMSGESHLLRVSEVDCSSKDYIGHDRSDSQADSADWWECQATHSATPVRPGMTDEEIGPFPAHGGKKPAIHAGYALKTSARIVLELVTAGRRQACKTVGSPTGDARRDGTRRPGPGDPRQHAAAKLLAG